MQTTIIPIGKNAFFYIADFYKRAEKANLSEEQIEMIVTDMMRDSCKYL